MFQPKNQFTKIVSNFRQILQKKYDAIAKENSFLTINSIQIEDYKNKIDLLFLKVVRYHNSQKVSNLRENSRKEENTINKTKSARKRKQYQYTTRYRQDRDIYILIMLLFAKIESLRTIDDEKSSEEKSKVQRIIDYYIQKPMIIIYYLSLLTIGCLYKTQQKEICLLIILLLFIMK